MNEVGIKKFEAKKSIGELKDEIGYLKHNLHYVCAYHAVLITILESHGLINLAKFMETSDELKQTYEVWLERNANCATVMQ